LYNALPISALTHTTLNRQDAKDAKKREREDIIFSLVGVLGVLAVQ
jgi:hypothetical protein